MTDPDLAGLLTAIRDEIVGLRADLAGRQRGRLCQRDRDLLECALPTIATAVQDRAFAVSELRAHSELPAEAALRAALAPLGGPHAIGRLFKRAQGVPVDGLTLESVGVDCDGRVWRLSGVHRRDPRTGE